MSTKEAVVNFSILIYRILVIYCQVLINFLRPIKRKSIEGKNVLITGSGHGLGREMAIRFGKLGANLALVDINEDNNEETKELIMKETSDEQNNSTVKVMTYRADIRKESKVESLKKKIESDLGQVDILINNAGIVQCKPFLELSSDMVERTFEVNTLAHIWTIRHFLPAMIEKGEGHIVAISSIAGLIGGKFITDYCASKFAVVGLMDALEKEIHDGGLNENIRLTTICPASMSTGMFKSFTSRFSWFLPVLNAGQVADEVLDSVLKNRSLVAVPARTLFLHRISSIVPNKVNHLIQDYLDYGVKPHAK